MNTFLAKLRKGGFIMNLIPRTIENSAYIFVLVTVLLIALAGGVTNAEWTAYNDCISWSGDGTHQYATEYTIYSGETLNASGPLQDISTGSTTGMPTVTFKMNENIPAQGPGTGTTDSLFSGTDAYDVFNGKVDFSGKSPSGESGVIYYGSRVGWWVDITFTGLDPDKIYTFVGTAIRGNSSYTNRFTRCTIMGAEHFVNAGSGDTVNGGARARSANVTELLTGDNSSSTTGYVIRWDYITVADEGSGTGSFKIRTEATGDSASNYKAYPLGGFMLEEVGDIGNLPPMVYADGDKAYWLPSASGTVDIKFDADVYDDGLPVDPGEVTTTWSWVDEREGPTVDFDDSSIVDVTATFDTAGDYVLRLTADDDGVNYYWDEVKVHIYAHDAASPSFEKGPYLMFTGVNTEMDVLWQIDKSATCFLKWGENQSLNPPDGSVYTDEVSLGTYGHQHIYTITGLDTDTKYYYKIEAGVGEGVYETGSFRTAPSASATNVKFLAYGDTRGNSGVPPANHDLVCEEMIETYTNRDSMFQRFLLHDGDWVEHGDDEYDWENEYFNRDLTNAQSMLANLPVLGCMGNHEQHGGLFVKYWPYQYFGDSVRYGLFDYGPVRVVVADQYAYGSYSSTNRMQDTLGESGAQLDWIKDKLSNSPKKWNLLLLHQPYYTAGNHNISESPKLKPEMEDLFVNEGSRNINEDVDIVFAGHNHYYAHCLEEEVRHITTGGGGAPFPTNPGFPYAPPGPDGNIEASARKHHFCEIDIRDRVLRCRARDTSGVKIDVFTLLHDGTHYYVKEDGSNDNNGTSWSQAFATISYAISQAQNKDLIEVAEGTYEERIDFTGKAITITSTDPEDQTTVENTVIYLGGPYIYKDGIVNFDSGEGSDSILTGFTIKGDGRGAYGTYYKNGIYCENSSPTISNCVIKETCLATYCKGAAPAIKNSRIYNNWQGAWYDDSSAAKIKNSWIYDNDWGIEVENSPLVEVIGDTIVGNTNEGIWSNTTPGPTVTNCIIWDNDVDGDEELVNCDPAKVSYCCIMGGYTGGFEIIDDPPDFVNIYDFWDMTVADGTQNTIIVADASLYKIDDVIEYADDGIVRTVTNINIPTGTITFDNPLGSNSVEDTRINNWGPYAADLQEDYHLQPTSHCINKGDTAYVADDYETDIDGQPRIQGCTPESMIVDMGADETPYNTVWCVDAGGNSDGRCWATAFGSIQEAIDAACDGDIIDVNVGTYYETIDFKGKRITVRSKNPDDPNVVASTVIDANSDVGSPGRGVTFDSGEDADSVLTGFVITGGYAPGTGIDRDGGGIFCYGSSPTISKCDIIQNYAGDDGGGIFCDNGSDAEISDCTVSDNESGDKGGGMYCRDSNPTVKNSDVSSNDAYTGGGLYFTASEPLIECCIISDNQTSGDSSADGGGIYCLSSDATIVNCIISDNISDDDAGGICCLTGSDATITNCTLGGNQADDKGGGIYCKDGSDAVITNCIVWGNTAPTGSQIHTATSSPVVSYSDIQGTPVYSGTGNINTNPAFEDAANGDYYLLPSSPCIDIGDSNGDYGGQVDIEGDSRVIDIGGRGDGTVDVDMGADEVAGDVHNIDRVIDYFSIQASINAANNGNVIEVEEGTYYETIDFNDKSITVTSTDPEDPGVVANTIIDANGDAGNPRRVVTFDDGEDANSVLVGFTITGGYAPGTGDARDGSGIFCYGSSPTISNCVITGNYAGDDGGGIFCDNGSEATISKCTVNANEAGDRGGGMYCRDSNSTIQDCDVNSNDAYMGGGLYYTASEPLVEGCTISDNNSSGGGSDPDGGGICCLSSNATIINCIIRDNSAEDDGGGIFCDSGSDATITDCTVSGNETDDKGGGIYCRNSCPEVVDCVFKGNTAGTDGGGLYCTDKSPTINRCVFSDNYAGDDGGGIHTLGCGPTISNSFVYSNEATDKGGGMYLRDEDANLINCTITDNTAVDGGGIYNRYSDTQITSCILWADSASSSGDEIYNYYSTPVVRYSDVEGGWDGTGNIDSDPCFVDANAGDFHLDSNSPCIDVGDPSGNYDGMKDIDGDDRVIDIPAKGDGIVDVDMGADEYNPQ